MNFLKSVAIISIIIYHTCGDFLDSGYIGVDVFFALSGLLITNSIFSKLPEHGFSLSEFMKHRWLRLFPSIFLMLIIILAISQFFNPDFRVDILSIIFAIFSWTMNWFLITSGTGYMNQLSPNFMQHLWFVSVEMQFYLLFGLVVALLIFLVSLINQKRKIGSKFNNYLVLVGIFIISGILVLVGYSLTQYYLQQNDDYSFMYLNFFTHMTSLFIGVAAGAIYLSFPGLKKFPELVQRKKKLQFALLLIFLIGFIVLLIPNFSSPFYFEYGQILTCLLTLVVGFGFIKQPKNAPSTHPTQSVEIASERPTHFESGKINLLPEDTLSSISKKTPSKFTLEKIFDYVGSRSYQIYLFHYPLFILTNNLLITLPIALLLSEFSYQMVEKVVLSKKFLKRFFITPAIGIALLVFAIPPVLSAPAISSTENNILVQARSNGVQEISAIAQNVTAIQYLPPVIDNENSDLLPLTPSEAKKQAESAAAKKKVAEEKSKSAQEITNLANAAALIVGDSVCLNASQEIKDAISGIYVDCKVSRHMSDGYNIIKKLKKSNRIPKTVIIELGINDWGSGLDSLKSIIKTIGTETKIVVVTAYGILSQYGYVTAYNKSLKKIADGYDNVSVADWAAAISKHEDWLSADGFHPGNDKARKLLAKTIAEAL